MFHGDSVSILHIIKKLVKRRQKALNSKKKKKNLIFATAQLESNFEEMEGHLMYLENLCGQCELQHFKHFQILQLENYKKKKR